MSDDDAFRIRVTWTPVYMPGGLFLREQWESMIGPNTFWGPIPPEVTITEAVDERKRVINAMVEVQAKRALEHLGEIDLKLAEIKGATPWKS
jgi:hypothetical protein